MSKKDTEIYEVIGERLAKARKKAGLTQEQLAEQSGIYRSHVGFIEQGRRKPTISSLNKLLTTLNISFEELFKNL